jgi:hypothetical protein
MLTQETAQSLVNKNGQTTLRLAIMQDEYLTREVLGHAADVNIRNLDGDVLALVHSFSL